MIYQLQILGRCGVEVGVKIIPIIVRGQSGNFYLLLEELAEQPRRLVVTFDEPDARRVVARMKGGKTVHPTFCDFLAELLHDMGIALERIVIDGGPPRAIGRVWMHHLGRSYPRELAAQDGIELSVKTHCPLMVSDETMREGNGDGQKLHQRIQAVEKLADNQATAALIDTLGDNPKES